MPAAGNKRGVGQPRVEDQVFQRMLQGRQKDEDWRGRGCVGEKTRSQQKRGSGKVRKNLRTTRSEGEERTSDLGVQELRGEHRPA